MRNSKKNHFHELLYIPGYSVDFTRQEKMCFVIVRQAITISKYLKKIGFALTFLRQFLHACDIRPKYKTINFNAIKEKFKVNKIFLIKAKYKLLVIANLRFHLFVQLLFLISYFSSFGNKVIYVIKAEYKISKIYLIKEKYKLVFVTNLKLHLYDQLLFLITYFFSFLDAVIHAIKAKYEIYKIYVIKARYTLLVIVTISFICFVILF